MSPTPTRRVVLSLASVLALGVPDGVGVAAGPDPYATCRAQFARKPDDYESAYCFYRITLEERRWDEGAQVFEDFVAAGGRIPVVSARPEVVTVKLLSAKYPDVMTHGAITDCRCLHRF